MAFKQPLLNLKTQPWFFSWLGLVAIYSLRQHGPQFKNNLIQLINIKCKLIKWIGKDLSCRSKYSVNFSYPMLRVTHPSRNFFVLSLVLVSNVVPCSFWKNKIKNNLNQIFIIFGLICFLLFWKGYIIIYISYFSLKDNQSNSGSAFKCVFQGQEWTNEVKNGPQNRTCKSTLNNNFNTWTSHKIQK